jgi:hypothetical protein
MAFEEKNEGTGEQPPQYAGPVPPQQPYQQPGVPPVYHNTYVTAVATEAKGNGLGVAALVLGIIAIIGSPVPFLNVFSFILAIIALCLGIAGLVVGTTKNRPKGTAIVGLVLAIISIGIFTISNVTTLAAIGSAVDANGSSTAGQSDGSHTSDAEEETIVPLGTAVNTAKFEILVNGSSNSTRINNGNYLYYEPDTGNEYAIINVTLKNISNEMESFRCSDFQLITLDDSIKYSPSSMIVSSGDETFFWLDSMNPSTVKTGNVVFELPQGIDLSTLKLQYNDTWSFDTNDYFFAIQ